MLIGGNFILPPITISLTEKSLYLKLQHYPFAAVAYTCGYDLTCPPAMMAPNRCKRQHLRLSFRCSLSWKHSETHIHIWIKRGVCFYANEKWQQQHAELISCMHPVTLYYPRSLQYRTFFTCSSVLQIESEVLTALMHRCDTSFLWLQPLTIR